MLTLAVHSISVDGDAAHHDIIDDGETAFASDPVASTVADAAVGQNGSLILLDTSTVELLRNRNFIWVEEIPGRSVDNFIGGMAKNVDNRV